MRITVERLDDDIRRQWITRLIAGDEEAIIPISESYVPFALVLAKGYFERLGKQDEAVSVAMAGLVMSVTRICKIDYQYDESRIDASISGFLRLHIEGELKKLYREDHVINIKRSFDGSWPIYVSEEHYQAEYDDVFACDDYDSYYKELKLNERERIIIGLRLEGLTITQIAKEFEQERPMIYRTLTIIQNKWREHYGIAHTARC